MSDSETLCEKLTSAMVCFVVECRNADGRVVREFHEHILKYRLSNDSRRSLLGALVIHFSKMDVKTHHELSLEYTRTATC
jgi:hypothetical protein